MSDQRKHVTQMSRREITAVLAHIQGIKLTGFDNAHVCDRKNKWNVTDGDIRAALRGELIEVHANNLPDIRFVMRNDSGMRSICVCASLTGELVTVWVNTANDHHSTIKMSDYKWNTDITNVLNAWGK